jgi:ABC-type lipoprotein release transport system permease subunit
MNLNKLAWRNLWRHKRRTLITASSIAFGVLLSVTFTGAGDYFYTRMIDAGASMGMGHITIEAIDYNRAPSTQKRIAHTDVLRQQTLNFAGVNDVAVRINGQAMFASARKSIAGLFIGIDPAQENKGNNLFSRSMVKGQMLQSIDGDGIVIGVDLASKLNLDLGKKLVYTTTDVNGEIVSSIARVKGLFKTGVAEVDSAVGILPLHSSQKTLGYQTDEATLLAVILKDQRLAVKTKAVMSADSLYAGLEVLTWQQSQPDLASFIAVDRTNNYVSQLLIALLVAAGILNTMLMSVLERTREFGVMMAIGMSPLSLFALVMLESLGLAIIGLVLGTLVSIPWYWYMSTTGIDLAGAYGVDVSLSGVLLDPVFKIRLFKESIMAILLGVFSLALLSGLYPAWQAGRIPPVDSLKTI